LDGSGREFVRNNDELTCYLPDQRTVLVQPRPEHGPFLGSLPQFGADVNEFYRIEALPATHILGRPARVIAVNPKDQFRFGYRLWLDEKSAMPLKTQLCDSHGQVIEQIFFARLDMPESIPDSDLAPVVHTDGMRWVRQGPSHDSAPAAVSGYRASELPPGFHLTVEGAQTIGEASVPASHLVYSDGLATARRRAGYGCQRRAGRAADAGPGARRFGIRILNRGSGSSGHRGGRGARPDGGVHCPLGEVIRRRRPAAPLNRADGAAALCDVFEVGLRSVRGNVE
jgi:hypothetical protein